VLAASREHDLQVVCDPANDFPFLGPWPDDYAGAIETEAGFLYVEECVRAHLDTAAALGATVRAEEPVIDWRAGEPTVLGDSVTVRTAAGTYHAAKLVVTAGAWATRLLADIGVPLSVMRQTLLWFAPHDSAQFRRDRFPIFIADTPQGAFYGLPMIDPRGVKLARHYGQPELPSPDGVSWDVTAADETPVRAFLDAYLPGQFGRRTHGEACMYTLSPDRHFVIDRHPRHPNVAVAAGFSGHGFKFASVVGEILADLALRGETDLPIGLFRASRFGDRTPPR
jgi:sarcosine oxidase